MATWPLGAAHSSTSVSPSPGFPPVPPSTDASIPLAMSEDVEEETEEEQERWEFVSGSTVTPRSPLATFLSIQPIFRYQLLPEGGKTQGEKSSWGDSLLFAKELRFTTMADLVSGNRCFGWEPVVLSPTARLGNKHTLEGIEAKRLNCAVRLSALSLYHTSTHTPTQKLEHVLWQ